MGGDTPRDLCGLQRTLECPQSTAGLCRTSHPVPKCGLAPGPWVEVEQRKECFPQEVGEPGGKTGVARGESRFPSQRSTVFLAKLLSRAACEPEQADRWLAWPLCRRMGCPVLGGGLCLPGLGTPAGEGATLFPETRLSRPRAVLQCRRLTVKAGPHRLSAGPS